MREAICFKAVLTTILLTAVTALGGVNEDYIKAAHLGHFLDVKKFLKDPKVDVNAQSFNVTALEYAARNSNRRVIKEILKRPGVKVLGAVKVACHNKDLRVFKALVGYSEANVSQIMAISLWLNFMEGFNFALKENKFKMSETFGVDFFRKYGGPSLELPNAYFKNLDLIELTAFFNRVDALKSLLNHTSSEVNSDKMIKVLKLAEFNKGFNFLQALFSNSKAVPADKVAVINEIVRVHGWYRNYGAWILNDSDLKFKLEVLNEILKDESLDLSVKEGVNSPLIEAASWGRLKFLKALLSHRSAPNINFNNQLGNTMLSEAAAYDEYAVVDYLLNEMGADPSLKNKEGKTAFIRALNFVQPIYKSTGARSIELLVKDERVNVNPLIGKNKKTPLLIAVSQSTEGTNYEAVTKALLTSKSIQINTLTDDGYYSPLIMASGHGSEEAVRLLLADNRTDVNFSNANGDTALDFAYIAGRENIVQTLEEFGAKSKNLKAHKRSMELGGKFLTKVKSGKSLEAIKFLKKHNNINVNMRDEEAGYSSFIFAIQLGDVNLIDALLDYSNLYINAAYGGRKFGKHNDTALTLAVENEDLGLVKKILKHRDIALGYRSPIKTSVEKENLEIFKVLLDHSTFDVKRDAVLSIATQKGLVEFVKILLDVPGVDLNRGYRGRNSPLTNAINHHEIVKLLLEKGKGKIDVNVNFGSPLVFALSRKKYETAKLLLDSPDIDVNIAAEFGGTPLNAAFRSNKVKGLKLLLAKPELIISTKGYSPLAEFLDSHYSPNIELVKEVMNDSRLNINDQGGWRKRTPLISAVASKNLSVVKLVLEKFKKVKLGVKDVDGKTALDYAQEDTSQEMLEILKILKSHK